MSLASLVNRASKLVVDNSPTILTALGVSGTVVTAVLAGRASIKAHEILVEEAQNNPDWLDNDLQHDIKLIWKEFIPPIAFGTLTIACIIGANRIGMRRAAALAAAYSLTEKAFDEYRMKVAEHLGNQREQTVRDDIAQDRVNNNPLSSREVIITGAGEVLCYDSITGRYFMSNVESLRKAQNDINHQLLTNFYACLDDFYRLIGLPTTPYANEVGWNSDHMLELDFSAVMSEDGRPCISIDYRVSPVRDYVRLQ